MRVDPFFEKACAIWKPIQKERRDAFPLVLAEVNSKAVKSGAFGSSAHGETCARNAGNELKARVAGIVASLTSARDLIQPFRTPAHNAKTFTRWAVARFLEEADDLRVLYRAPGHAGVADYAKHFELAEQRERERLDNDVDTYLRQKPLQFRLVRWALVAYYEVKDFAAKVLANMAGG